MWAAQRSGDDVMRAAILAIGDELTCGYQLDTNSQTISQRLVTIPVDVVLHLGVGDDSAAIRTALEFAIDAAEVIVVTGGLGPTEDDLTRQMIAAHFGLGLVEDARALQLIRERFAQRGGRMPETNRIQAQVPVGSQIIQNSRGTAAGFYLLARGKHIFAVPGVPFEMLGMLENFIIPTLRGLVDQGRYVQREAVKVYGIPESEINERIRPMLARDRNPLLGLLPNLGTITIEIVATADSPEYVRELVEDDLLQLRTEFGDCIISEDGSDLPQVVGSLMKERSLTISSAELGTGGLLAARLTEPKDSQYWFRGGFAVHRGNLDTNAPSQSSEAALSLARFARKETRSDVGLGIGEIVSGGAPTGNSYVVCAVAVDIRGHAVCRQFNFRTERAREWAADAALAMVRAELLNSSHQSC
jgi:nicotinamide-nucleotide amidase